MSATSKTPPEPYNLRLEIPAWEGGDTWEGGSPSAPESQGPPGAPQRNSSPGTNLLLNPTVEPKLTWNLPSDFKLSWMKRRRRSLQCWDTFTTSLDVCHIINGELTDNRLLLWQMESRRGWARRADLAVGNYSPRTTSLLRGRGMGGAPRGAPITATVVLTMFCMASGSSFPRHAIIYIQPQPLLLLLIELMLLFVL